MTATAAAPPLPAGLDAPGVGLGTLVRVELGKLRTTRTWWGIALGVVALTVIAVLGNTLSSGDARSDTSVLSTVEGVRGVAASPASNLIFGLVLGILGMAGEYRHATITQALLVTPRRGRLVAAKLLAYALAGLGYGALAVAITLALGTPLLASRHAAYSLVDPQVVGTLLGSGALVALYAVLGVGIGALITNQVVALSVSLAYVFVAESLLVALVRPVGRWLPGGAAQAVFGSARPDLLPPWAGGLLLVGYALAFAVLGAATTLRRDVT